MLQASLIGPIHKLRRKQSVVNTAPGIYHKSGAILNGLSPCLQILDLAYFAKDKCTSLFVKSKSDEESKKSFFPLKVKKVFKNFLLIFIARVRL